jgi:hypothetical protein
MTRLDEALAGVTTLGFDTSPFIYFIERHPTYIDVVREVIRRVDAGMVRGYILYAALDKTFFFDPLDTVCCPPITGTFWNV